MDGKHSHPIVLRQVQSTKFSTSYLHPNNVTIVTLPPIVNGYGGEPDPDYQIGELILVNGTMLAIIEDAKFMKEFMDYEWKARVL